MAGDRAGGAEYAERVNAAADLAEAGVPVAEAARMLAGRFGCSQRQARRFAQRAGRVGADDLRRGGPGSGGVLGAGPQRASAQVSDRMVEGEYVFGRHAATDLSVAYAILVPPRRARFRVGQEGRPPRDERGDLRPGLQRPAEEGPDDRVADRGAARPRQAARG